MNNRQYESGKSFFNYNAKTYSGYVFGSTDIIPNQYWFFFCDPELVEEMSDCVLFNEAEGQLSPVRSYAGHENLVKIIGGMIRNKLVRGDFIAAV